MANSYDVIVAGVGGMGSAACWHLAQRGQRVLGLERFDLGHGMGSSHGLTRIIRLAYFEGSHYVPMLKRAHQLWKETGEAANTQLLYVTGSIDLAPEGAGFVESSLASCIEHGLAHEVLDARAIAARFPAFKLTPQHKGLWQPDGGFVASERAIYAHAGLAMARGAEIRTNEPILSWRPTAHGGVEVTTARGTYSAGKLILSAGAWNPELAQALAPNAAVVKQTIGWFAVSKPALFQPDRFPVFILTVDEGNFYGFPLWEHPGFKLGGPHFARQPFDPNDSERVANEGQVDAIRQCLARYIPDAAGAPLTVRACMYTVTPDEHFVIDALPGAEQVTLLSCCSGHGYKFASVIGEIAADLATTGQSAFDLSPFSLARFQKAAA
ncbi:MAG: N-methyltryptophan oxidase [Rhizobiales bacterium 65-9]|nr:N-methyl-L-tryptophan oxidase [Hyphomicrobiales bacterium]OJY37366.1 MAG: N-methyltryptophan oxidase [Rhizobiales bacterium 65-9]